MQALDNEYPPEDRKKEDLLSDVVSVALGFTILQNVRYVQELRKLNLSLEEFEIYFQTEANNFRDEYTFRTKKLLQQCHKVFLLITIQNNNKEGEEEKDLLKIEVFFQTASVSLCRLYDVRVLANNAKIADVIMESIKPFKDKIIGYTTLGNKCLDLGNDFLNIDLFMNIEYALSEDIMNNLKNFDLDWLFVYAKDAWNIEEPQAFRGKSLYLIALNNYIKKVLKFDNKETAKWKSRNISLVNILTESSKVITEACNCNKLAHFLNKIELLQSKFLQQPKAFVKTLQVLNQDLTITKKLCASQDWIPFTSSLLTQSQVQYFLSLEEKTVKQWQYLRLSTCNLIKRLDYKLQR